jgi:hypothetical protein
MPKRAIIFGVLLLAVAAAAAFMLRPKPETVLRRAQMRLMTEKTMRLEVEAALTPPQDLGGAVVPSATSVDIVMRVDLDRTDPVRPASVTSFSAAQGSGAEAKTLSGEARRRDGRHYLKLDGTGGLDAEIAGRLKGAWVASDRPFMEFIAPPDERALAERPLDAAGHAAMAAAVGGVDLFTVLAEKPVEPYGDTEARRYAVEVNLEAVTALLVKLRELRTGAPIGAEDVLAATAAIARWGAPVGEVWIDKRTGKFLEIGLASGIEGVGTVAGGSVSFSRYGEPVAVAAPEAEELERVLGPLFAKRLNLAGDRAAQGEDAAGVAAPRQSGTLPSATIAAEETDGDGDGLSDAQEFFYGSDAWNPDTDADGWHDGLEVEKGMNPVGPGTLFGFGL